MTLLLVIYDLQLWEYFTSIAAQNVKTSDKTIKYFIINMNLKLFIRQLFC